MNPVVLAFAIVPLLCVAACDTLGSTPRSIDAPSVPSAPTTDIPDAKLSDAPTPDVGALLAGVSDGPSAEAAKGLLETAIAGLKNALAGVDAKAKVDGAATGSTDTADKSKQLAADLLAKFGLGANTADTITRLLDNPAVKSAIGPMLEQLKGLIPAR